MRRMQDAMLGAIDLRTLHLRKVAPEHEHDAFALSINNFDDAICEALPATISVRVGLPLLHRQTMAKGQRYGFG